MAEKLRTFDFDKPSEITSSEKRSYPWELWLDGDIWQLKQGEDFDTHPLMMERIVRTRAVTRQAKVRLRHQPFPNNNGDPFGMLIIQRTDKVGPADAKKAEARAKREAKKAEAAKEAEALLASNGIKPKTAVKQKAAAAVPTKAPSKHRRPTPSKRPARRSAAIPAGIPT